MRRLRFLFTLLTWLPLGLASTPACAQNSEVPGPVVGAPAQRPELRLPELRDLHLAVPRPVRAATAALGLGRQRLALVVGIGTVGAQRVVDAAARDTQAVAAALRAGGFVVMLREDVNAADLRASLKEYRQRLEPGGVGFIYLTGLGLQIDGQNHLLARDARLDNVAGPTPAETLRDAAVPMSEAVEALMGPPGSPRLLVVDAAYEHPALARLSAPGLTEQRLPPGMMALFGHALGSWQAVPAAADLPSPAPTDPRDIASTRFASVLVAALITPRISGPEALRHTRRTIFDGSQGQANPWLAGDTDAREEFAEATLLDGLIPRTPEELAREAARQGSRLLSRPAGARTGEQAVGEVLQEAANKPTTTPGGTPTTASPTPAETARAPEVASGGGMGNALDTAASAVGTVASVAGSVAAVGAGIRAAETAAAVSAANTAIGAAGSVAGRVVALATRAGSGGAGEAPAREAVRQMAGARVVPPAAAPGPAPALAAAAAPGSGPVAFPATPGVPAAVPAPPPGVGPPASSAPNPDTAPPPASVPRSNAFGYAEGDTFSYRVIDGWKDEVVGHYTTAIEQVLEDGQLLANGHQVQMDPQGRIKRQVTGDGGVSEFEPSQDLWWANPRRGESRSSKFKEIFRRADRSRGETEWKGSTSVGKLRTIKLPAGEFEVLPLETSGWYYETLANGARNSGQFSRTVWYSPRLGHPVAIDIQDADRLGKLLKRERVELMHAQSARTLSP